VGERKFALPLIHARPPGSGLERWSAEQLGLAEDAAPEAVRAAVFRELPEQDFVPSFAWHQAAIVLTRPNQKVLLDDALRGHLLRTEEESLREEVEEFAAEFFTLPVPQRQVRYQALERQVATFPALEARLASLQRGLTFTVPNVDAQAPQVRELLKYIVELFPLRPGPFSARTGELFYNMQWDKAAWQNAGLLVQRHLPAVAALAPRFLSQLAGWTEQERATEKGRKRVLKRRPGAAEKSEGGFPRWLISVFVIVGIGLIRLLVNLSGDSKSSGSRVTIPPPPQFEHVKPQLPSSGVPSNLSQRPGESADEWLKRIRGHLQSSPEGPIRNRPGVTPPQGPIRDEKVNDLLKRIRERTESPPGMPQTGGGDRRPGTRSGGPPLPPTSGSRPP
jgi:hypothetical protein